MTKFKTIKPGEVTTATLHSFLLSGIAPRPIAFVSSSDAAGNINLSPFSYFNVFGSNPPLLIFSPARRVRDNTIKHTLENAMEYPEVVVNMVDIHMVEQMSLSSTEYEKGVNEFLKSGLTPAKSQVVAVPRVLEAPVAFECKVVQVIETGDSGGAGNLVLCEVMAIHARQDILNEDGLIDPLKLELVGRMGGSWYTKTDKSTMFEIPKPLKTKGIGVDQLPGNAKESDVLTGNNLGRLGNVERKASKEEIMQCQTEAVELGFLKLDKNERLIAIHTHVRALLEKGQVQTALAWVSFIEETGVD